MPRKTLHQRPASEAKASDVASRGTAGIGRVAVPVSERSTARWTFLSNHAHVLILLARNPSMVLREVAMLVGITERAVQRIIADLEAESFIEREKVGRQNHYRVLGNKSLRHPIESHRNVADLLRAIDGTS